MESIETECCRLVEGEISEFVPITPASEFIHSHGTALSGHRGAPSGEEPLLRCDGCQHTLHARFQHTYARARFQATPSGGRADEPTSAAFGSPRRAVLHLEAAVVHLPSSGGKPIAPVNADTWTPAWTRLSRGEAARL